MDESKDRFLIRECQDADRNEADRVSDAAFQSVRHIYRPSPEALERKKSRSPVSRLLAIHRNELQRDAIVGSVEYEIRQDQISLMALAVHPDWRRRGIARRLVAELQRKCREEGILKLSLWTIIQTGNVPIFERLGFDVVRIEQADLFESDSFIELQEALMELEF